MDNKQIGFMGEEIVAKALIEKGYTILKKNFCIRGGEIDIIAQIEDIIAFIEVKTRKAECLVSGISAVTRSKQRLIIKTAAAYMIKYPNNLQPRFDVAEVTLNCNNVLGWEYIENAFDASGYDIIF